MRKYNNKQGVVLTTLVITVIVLLILLTTISFVGTLAYRDVRVKTYIADVTKIQHVILAHENQIIDNKIPNPKYTTQSRFQNYIQLKPEFFKNFNVDLKGNDLTFVFDKDDPSRVFGILPGKNGTFEQVTTYNNARITPEVISKETTTKKEPITRMNITTNLEQKLNKNS